MNQLFIVKILRLIPRPIQKFIGYSFLGTKLVRWFKTSDSKTAFDIDNGLKIYLELSNPLTWDLVLGKDVEKDVKDQFLQNILFKYYSINTVRNNLCSSHSFFRYDVS